MDIKFRVHGVTTIPVLVEVEHNGEKVLATIEGAEVELVTESNSSLTLRFTGAEAEQAKQVFTPDKTVTWTIK